MKRIIFVDDEAAVLSGLRRMLRPMRHQWEMNFFDSGRRALAALAAAPADVVVSDMRMPTMDGYELLSRIRLEHPDTVRFILSGQSELETVIKLSDVAHQFLSKPCDVDQIRTAIDRVIALRGRLDNADVRRAVADTDDLPALPRTYTDLTTELQRDEPSLAVIESVMAADPALATKALRLVNSSYFRPATPVSSVDRAVAMLGANGVSSLLLGLDSYTGWHDARRAGVSIGALWCRPAASVTTEDASPADPRHADRTQSDAYLAGLVHAIGRLLLAWRLPRDWAEVQRRVSDGTAESDAERAVFGTTHEDVGAYVLGLWGLSSDVLTPTPRRDQAAAGSTNSSAARALARPTGHVLVGAGRSEAQAVRQPLVRSRATANEGWGND